MYTVTEDVADDHYADFVDTLRFLTGEDGGEQISDEFSRYRNALLGVENAGIQSARACRRDLERALSRVLIPRCSGFWNKSAAYVSPTVGCLNRQTDSSVG